LNKTAYAALLVALVGVSLILIALPPAGGQLGLNILQVQPTEAAARQTVNVQGTINTSNGPYRLFLGNTLVTMGNAEGFYVNANFTVPEIPGGTYTMILRDSTTNQMANSNFIVKTGYFITPMIPASPEQLQEGDDVAINVTVAGGLPDMTYAANVTVTLPEPLQTSYSQVINLALTSSTGTASAKVTFPSGAFQPSGSYTGFAGSYNVYFNKTQDLASDNFSVGFTDATEYHRGQLVSIHAVSYEASQSATIKITNQATGGVADTFAVTASGEGAITASYTVPNNAEIGKYQISITPNGTQKRKADVQNYTVPGYPVTFRTVNLAGDTVPQILIEAVDPVNNALYSAISNNDGLAKLSLESGDHNITAYWNGVKVAQVSISVTGKSQLDLTCELTNLKVTVQDKNGFRIPDVSLKISYTYITTKDGVSQTGSHSGETDITGTFYLNSTLPKITYTVNASVYGRVFNSGNSTFSDILAVPTYSVVLLFPSENITLTTLDYNHHAIVNARLTLGEITSGILYVASTDSHGSAQVEAAFGVYELKVYHGTVLLNQTIIEVFSNVQRSVVCVLYNLPVSVQVVDYLGQHIPGMNVVYRGPDGTAQSKTTQEDGVAVFDNVIGGDAQITVYANGQDSNYEALNVQVTSPEPVQVKMGQSILIAGILVDISGFVTAIVILVIMVLFLLFELYQRRKRKSIENKSIANASAK
jgi:hypothetical protein